MLACVRSVPRERLAGAAVVSGLYPVALGTEGMMTGLRVMLWGGQWVGGVVGLVADWVVGRAARDADPRVYEEVLVKAIEGRLEIDKRAMKDGKNWGGFCEGTREGLRQGGEGTGVENRLNGGAWGFELGELRVGEGEVRLTLWHGTEDVNCPAGMARKAHALMPGAELRMVEGEGHVSFGFNHQEEILRDLIGEREMC